MTPDSVVTAAYACIGAPFRHQGRDPATGLDCAGLVVRVALDLGCDVIDEQGYGREPSGGRLEQMLDTQTCLQRLDDVGTMQRGDVLLMRFEGEPQHLAILGEGVMIHAWEKVGLCCEHELNTKWVRRIVRVYRFTEVM